MQKRRLIAFLLCFCILQNVSSSEKEAKALNYSKKKEKNLPNSKSSDTQRVDSKITEAKFEESSAPAPKEVAKELGPKKKFKGKYSDDLLIMSDESKKEKTVKELNVLVGGLETLINHEKNESKKIDLIFSKASAYLNIAKNYRLTTKKDKSYQEKETFNLNKSIKYALEVENSKYSDAVLKAKALHLHGLAVLFLHKEAMAVDYFSKAIIMNKNSSVNPKLSVFIAEYLFDTEKYYEALPRYSEYFTQLSQEEKAMVIYKSGWCFVMTKQYENAEKAFVKLIGKPWAGDFSTDALRDLAFTVTSHMKEQEIIDFGLAQLPHKNSQILVDFYTEAYLVFLKQSGNIDRPILYNEILRIEKRSERKIALSVKKLTSHQKEYASIVPIEDLMKIEQLLKEYGIKTGTEPFKYFGSELENETIKIIKAYADTIAKKLKTPEKIDDMLMSANLEKVLWFHISWFPDSPKISQSYRVSLDNCIYLKSNECSIKISHDILKMENLKDIWERARYDLITSLDKMTVKDPKYKDELYSELQLFAVNQESSKHWLSFTKRLTMLQLEAKKLDEAYPLLDKINAKEPTSENLYRKLLCAYQLNNYSLVYESFAKVPKDGPYFTEIQSMMRESSLQLALEALKKDDFNKYEIYLAKFMSLNPDPAKADLAKVDYYQRLIDKEQFEKVASLLLPAKPEAKYTGVYSKISKQLFVSYLQVGKFNDVHNFLMKDTKIGQFPDFNPFWFRVLFASNQAMGMDEYKVFARSKSEERGSILGLLTLTKPDEVIKYFNDFPPADDREKKILLLSFQLKEGQREVFLTPKFFNMVKSIMPEDLLNTQVTPSERLANFINFPEVNWSEKRLEKVMPDAVSRIRTIRPQVLRDLKGKNYVVQSRILTKALSNETKMIAFFKSAPTPKGLPPENLEAYKKEIEHVAVEFSEQATEFTKMLEQINSKIVDRKKDDLIVPTDMRLWPKPNHPVTALIESEVAKKNYFSALVILETQRAIEKISIEDYHMLRPYVILSQFPNSVAIKYVKDELTAAKQDLFLIKWKELFMKKEPSSVDERQLASEKENKKMLDNKDKDKDKDKDKIENKN